MDDLEFVQQCVKGDKQSWDEFVDRYSRLIYNYIYSVLNTKGKNLPQENIEDIFQEIFLSLVKDSFKKLRSFKAKNGCSLASWLRQVTVNATIDQLRKLKPLVSLDEENIDDLSLKELLADNAAPIADSLSLEERFVHLKDCIDKLNTDDKYFMELHINRGVNLERLKDYFKLSRSALDMRKSRIIEKLKECFRSKNFVLDF